ncbi:cytochrome P450 [Aspergillus novofumigatus IBT 16806]|uniref:Cytochrome P450 n=1 Tax=Aspergillus novofumigatus (strain IBT 16806) TaxID=1392255 RepID=A0A2I1BUW1_ASPN1|nr:cytochrome P450 [Aspergillus novofumigatus IBT 16806]PKX89091.1 cytochrome P450 [Aspergillus novofumigatus IBT 16806]
MIYSTVLSVPASLQAFVTGVGLHYLVFRHGEWDLETPSVLRCFMVAEVLLLLQMVIQSKLDDHVDSFSATIIIQVTCGLLAGLWFSLLTYRGVFHRLRAFPGPFCARFSTLYQTYLMANHPDSFNVVQGMHKRYGDYVRLGPCEISINHPDAVGAIYSAKSQCMKAPWYGIGRPYESLFAVREKEEHVRRRRVWDMAMHPRCLEKYEIRLRNCMDALLQNVKIHEGMPVDVSQWFSCLAFDVASALAFGDTPHTSRDGNVHYILKALHRSRMGAILGNMVWLVSWMKTIPGFDSQVKLFIKYSEDEIIKARKKDQDDSFVFSWLWKDYLKGPQSKQARMNLTSDASLIVFAGSDAIAIVLTGLFYFLASMPQQLRRLQLEIDELQMGLDGKIDSDTLAKLPHLNGLINECLRLHYPGPSGFPRKTPPQGVYIGEKYIPGDVLVKVPFHTLFRDERNFERPEEFIPERWTTQKELVLKPSVFTPFLSGTYSCVGKQFALIELRHILVELVRRYEVRFAPEQNPDDYWCQRKDGYAMTVAPLSLVFETRSHEAVTTEH